MESEKYWETYNNDDVDDTKIPKFFFNDGPIGKKGDV